MSSRWRLEPAWRHLADDFGTLEAVFALEGERITRDPLSEVIRVEREGVRYYVKRYWGAGKGLRRLFGRPRIKAEWQNLQKFAKWGIPTPAIVAFGLERNAGFFVRGALITQELVGTVDLHRLVWRKDARLQDSAWVKLISQQVAVNTRIMHDKGFAHNDLKWRNLLVDESDKVFFIDCPAGDMWSGPLLKYRIVKDLACLDKLGKKLLRRTQRLRFYLMYQGVERLTDKQKAQVRKIEHFFEGRE